MANKARPQFFANDLQPIIINEPTLRRVLGELRAAVRRGIEQIQSKHKAPDGTEDEAFGTIFSGSLGIALMFLRLEEQAHALSDFNHINGKFEPPLPDFRTLMKENVSPNSVLKLKLQPGRPSPLCSPSLGTSVTRILATTHKSESGDLSPNDINHEIATLHEAVNIATAQDTVVIRNGHSMGGDEVLYGRAGLLWALGNIDRHNFDNGTAQALRPVLGKESKLWDAIMHAGRKGSEDYAKIHGKTEALPLMWPWLDEYYGLGAMHGITGILTIVLGYECSEPDYKAIGNTVTGLCKICILHNGHLPMSIPPWKSSRPSPLVQICHGTPGLLILLATAKGVSGLDKFQTVEWDEAIRLGTDRVWEEGLLSKGGGLCHGIAGNAWPWLLLHEKFAVEEHINLQRSGVESEISSPHEKPSADDLLSRALAFLLAARDTPPFATDSPYRMPDNPFSLFEGLAGTICAWSEACAVIRARLRRMEDPSRDPRSSSDGCSILGFPGLGGLAYTRRYDPSI